MGRGCAGWECLTTQACEALCFRALPPGPVDLSLCGDDGDAICAQKLAYTEHTHVAARAETAAYLDFNSLNFSFSDLDGVSN